MRTVTEPFNFGGFTIAAMGVPEFDGANYEYLVARNRGDRTETLCDIRFQAYGTPSSGISHECLLVIVIDRLRSLQNGLLASEHQAHALSACEEALAWLQKNRREWEARGQNETTR